MLANVVDVSHLWITSTLMGLALGSLYSLFPTICVEWFGIGVYLYLLCLCYYPLPLF